MSHGIIFIQAQEEQLDEIELSELLPILHAHGCELFTQNEGYSNDIKLPYNKDEMDAIGEFANLVIENGKVSSIGIHRPTFLGSFQALCYSLMVELDLVMFPDYGGIIYATEKTAPIVERWSKETLDSFDEGIRIVRKPEDISY